MKQQGDQLLTNKKVMCLSAHKQNKKVPQAKGEAKVWLVKSSYEPN